LLADAFRFQGVWEGSDPRVSPNPTLGTARTNRYDTLMSADTDGETPVTLFQYKSEGAQKGG